MAAALAPRGFGKGPDRPLGWLKHPVGQVVAQGAESLPQTIPQTQDVPISTGNNTAFRASRRQGAPVKSGSKFFLRDTGRFL